MIIDGVDIANYSQKELTTYSRNDVGFVFQFYNLVPNLTAKENVELASEIVADARDAEQTLIDVGLGKRLNNFPAQLSGGEQQRVLIGNSLLSDKKIFIFDEPASGLDYEHMLAVGKLLQELKAAGKIVLVITHDKELVTTVCDYQLDFEKYISDE